MEQLFSLLAKRQLTALAEIPRVFRQIFAALSGGAFPKAISLFAAVAQLFSAALFDTPIKPYKDRINMDDFTLVWSDEFDHGFDTEIWQGHYVYGEHDTQLRDTAWWNRDQVSFTDDGCLKLTVEYKEDGPKGPGYYSYGMETNPNKNYSGNHTGYEQLYGYFEIRCILAKGAGLNNAFWLLTDGMWADDTDGGVSGAEIDVFETPTAYDTGSRDFGSVYHTIHVDAYGDAHKSENQGSYYANDPYNEFNTYGVAWNEDGYTFYVNGVETAHTDFGGVCEVPLYLIISIGVDDQVKSNGFLPSSMIVDYVRCYQYK